jgi:predicted ArsR family transcriptional regulator
MTDDDKGTYLYQMRILQFLYERNGRKILDDIADFEIAKMERIWNDKGEKRGRGLQAFMEELWGGLKGEMEFDVEAAPDGELRIHCTSCPFASMARENGMAELGFHKFCMSDYGIVKGFDPRIEFTRTKTLMEGHDRCDHRYRFAG